MKVPVKYQSIVKDLEETFLTLCGSESFKFTLTSNTSVKMFYICRQYASTEIFLQALHSGNYSTNWRIKETEEGVEVTNETPFTDIKTLFHNIEILIGSLQTEILKEYDCI